MSRGKRAPGPGPRVDDNVPREGPLSCQAYVGHDPSPVHVSDCSMPVWANPSKFLGLGSLAPASQERGVRAQPNISAYISTATWRTRGAAARVDAHTHRVDGVMPQA